MSVKYQLRKIIPVFLWRKMSTLRDFILHRGEFNYRINKDRESLLDYTINCNQTNLRKAQKSILWDEDWKKATRATMAILVELDLVRRGQTVIDYGGAVGRISRALLEKFELKIILVDRSEQMRKHACRYIPKIFFKTGRVRIWSDVEFVGNYRTLAGQADLILFIEVLQHIPEPVLDELFPLLLSCISEEGRIFVLGNKDLDVDKEGRRHHKLIPDFLRQFVNVIREDVWEQFQVNGKQFRFSYPRYSYLCKIKS